MGKSESEIRVIESRRSRMEGPREFMGPPLYMAVWR